MTAEEAAAAERRLRVQRRRRGGRKTAKGKRMRPMRAASKRLRRGWARDSLGFRVARNDVESGVKDGSEEVGFARDREREESEADEGGHEEIAKRMGSQKMT